MMAQPNWRFSLLGDFRLWRDEVEVKPLQYRKVGSLLAYLAYFKDLSHERDELVRLFWADGTLDAGRNSLNVALTRLRKYLDDPTLLQTDRYQVWLAADAITTDVAQFQEHLKRSKRFLHDPKPRIEELKAAIALYGGSLLPGYDELWATTERQRLTDSFVQALEALAELLGEEGAWDDAIHYASLAVQTDRYRESSHQVLIRLYRDAGRPMAAKNQLDDMAKSYLEELNTLPSAQTRALVPRARPMMVYEDPEEPAPAHLPNEISRFFGRETERAELTTLLNEGSRLLTLLGMGGVGKTRLALEVIRPIAQDGKRVLWAPLAEVGPESQLFEVILGVLRRAGIPPLPHPPTPGTDPIEEEVVALLSKAPTILVLDNLEHLKEQKVHYLIRTLLGRVRRLTILGTSRHRLGITGEQVFHVAPLPLPQTSNPHDAVLDLPSVRLLQDRVRLLKPGYSIANEPLESVVALTAILEGIPLAIEMAAARLAHMPIALVVSKIEQNISILVNSNTDVPERHRSLHATLQWSYDLLSPELQEFLKQLAIFRGGWCLEGIEYVFQRQNAIGDLQKLCDVSLVNVDPVIVNDTNVLVYSVLDSTRQFFGKENDDLLEIGMKYLYWIASFGNGTFWNKYIIEIESDKMNGILEMIVKTGIISKDIVYFVYKLGEYFINYGFMVGMGVKCGKLLFNNIDWIDDFDYEMVKNVFEGVVVLSVVSLDREMTDVVTKRMLDISKGNALLLSRWRFQISLNRSDCGVFRERYIEACREIGGIHNESVYSEFNVVSSYIRDGEYEKALIMINESRKNCKRNINIAIFNLQEFHVRCETGELVDFNIDIDYIYDALSNDNHYRGLMYLDLVKSKYYLINNDLNKALDIGLKSGKAFASIPEWSQVGYVIEMLAVISVRCEYFKYAMRMIASCEEIRRRSNWVATPYEQMRWESLRDTLEQATKRSINQERDVVQKQSLENLLSEAFDLSVI